MRLSMNCLASILSWMRSLEVKNYLIYPSTSSLPIVSSIYANSVDFKLSSEYALLQLRCNRTISSVMVWDCFLNDNFISCFITSNFSAIFSSNSVNKPSTTYSKLSPLCYPKNIFIYQPSKSIGQFSVKNSSRRMISSTKTKYYESPCVIAHFVHSNLSGRQQVAFAQIYTIRCFSCPLTSQTKLAQPSKM